MFSDIPRQLRKLYPKRSPIAEPHSMPLVRQVEILLFDAYDDTTLTTTHLMSIIVVCVMYLRSRAMPDYLRDKLMNVVDFSEHLLAKDGVLNPRTLGHWHLNLATRNPEHIDGRPANGTINEIVDNVEIPDDPSGIDDID